MSGVCGRAKMYSALSTASDTYKAWHKGVSKFKNTEQVHACAFHDPARLFSALSANILPTTPCCSGPPSEANPKILPRTGPLSSSVTAIPQIRPVSPQSLPKKPQKEPQYALDVPHLGPNGP